MAPSAREILFRKSPKRVIRGEKLLHGQTNIGGDFTEQNR